MDLTPTTYTAPSSLASSPVAPIYDAWHALAGDFLTLAPTIRALPLDLVATSLGVPVWRTAWPDGVKEQVIAWYGQYGGRLYTRAGLAAFVWIFGGNLTTLGAITDYWETDPAGTPRTTAATPTTPLAYTDDVISSYIGQWMPLGYNLTLDSSAAVIAANLAIRRIIVTIPSGNPTLVPIGTEVYYGFELNYYVFDLLSLDPTDDSTIFTGIIAARTYDDANNAPAGAVELGGIYESVAYAVMDDSIPDGMLQCGYPDVVTGDPVLTTGRPGWDAVVTTTRAVLSIEVYNSDGDVYSDEFLDGALWTATYASGDAIKFYANPLNEDPVVRFVVSGVYGLTLRFVALQGGPLANSAFVSFTPDAPADPVVYDGAPVPVIVDILESGTTTTLPAIPAIPALGTPVPLPPFEA